MKRSIGVLLFFFALASVVAAQNINTTGITNIACLGSDDTELINSVQALGSSIRLVPGVTCAMNGGTIVVPLIAEGGLLKPVTGQVVTITGPFTAGPYRTFTNAVAGQGTVSFAGNGYVKEVYPQWWGGKPDGIQANETYIASAIASKSKRVFLSDGEWLLTAPVSISDTFVTVQCASQVGTYIEAGAGVASEFSFAAGGTSGGWVFDSCRFRLIGAGDSPSTGYVFDATAHKFIDSTIRNCWFDLPATAAGAFNGQMVNAKIVGNTFDGGIATIHATLCGLSRIEGNLFFSLYDSVISLDGASPGSVNEVQIANNIIFFHHRGSAIYLKNATNVSINGLIYSPDDTLPDISYFPTVIETVSSSISVTDLTVAGLTVYLDSDPGHTTPYMKIAQAIKVGSGSAVQVNGFKINNVQFGVKAATGVPVDIALSNGKISNATGTGMVYVNGNSGKLSVSNVDFVTSAYPWIYMDGVPTMDVFIRGCLFQDSSFPYGSLIVTKGRMLVIGNTFIKAVAGMANFVYADNAGGPGGRFDTNVFIQTIDLTGPVFNAGSVNYTNTNAINL